MDYTSIRNSLNKYYHEVLPDMVRKSKEKVFAEMDAYDAQNPGLSSYMLKSKLYDVIVDAMEPVIFPDIPFYFEAGILAPRCDGLYKRGGDHANGWLYLRNNHIFTDIDPHAREIYTGLIIQCGTYADMMHLQLPLKKVFKIGLSGILAEIKEAKRNCKTDEEQDFIMCCEAGINALCKIERKFSEALRKAGLQELADIAERVPFNAPKTMHEGLCTLAFMRKSLGAIEGMGFSSFGRVDVLLAPLYENDIKNGISEEILLDLITKFLLIQDCLLDRREKISKNSEQELENTLTLGGCDTEGNPIFNGVTKLFLKARDNEDIIFPKMMLRFGTNSPKEYLELIFSPLLVGRSFSLYSNDDSLIPALIRSGIDKNDAYDYAVGGCWDTLLGDVAIHNSGEYIHMLRPLEWSINNKIDSMRRKDLYFESLEECKTFDELYTRYICFMRRFFMLKHMIISRGAKVWHKVNPVGALSALMQPCIPNMRDITNAGGKYNRETAYLTCFAEVADSLLAIKNLCYDKKICSVAELLEQCRREWENEDLRQMAINSPSYGDGSYESVALVSKLINDLYDITRDLPLSQPGEVRLGSHLYTEVMFWADDIPAMPNGRRRGDYLSQGFSPSRFQGSVSLSDLFYTYRNIDMTKFSSSTSVTLTLPSANLDIDRLIAIFRAAAQSGLQSIQPNIINKEDLIAAQQNPDKYRHIIVRVCGFSAPFVDLSREYQNEFLNRMVFKL